MPNQTKIPQAVPQHYDWYTARMQLGIDKTKKIKYKSYGVCNQVADKDFPPATETGTIGLDPIVMSRSLPCTVTLKDTNNVVYQVTVKQANITAIYRIRFGQLSSQVPGRISIPTCCPATRLRPGALTSSKMRLPELIQTQNQITPLPFRSRSSLRGDDPPPLMIRPH